MIQRLPTDKCLICQINDADKTGSHFTPAGLIKKPFGKRDFEEIYSIDSHLGAVDVYYGRSNLRNEDPEIQEPVHMQDYIFCTSCESRLGLLESECIQKLNLMVEHASHLHKNVSYTQKGNQYSTIEGLNSNILTLFFYSIILRQLIQQRLINGSDIISKDLENTIRNIVVTDMYKPFEEIIGSNLYKSYPDIVIITNLNQTDFTKGSVCPSTTISNPDIFYMGIVDSLLFKSDQTSKNFATDLGLSPNLFDDELKLNSSLFSKIAILSDEAWSLKIDTFFGREADVFLDKRVKGLMKSKGWSYEFSKYLLHAKAREIQKKTDEQYYQCIRKSYDSLINS